MMNLEGELSPAQVLLAWKGRRDQSLTAWECTAHLSGSWNWERGSLAIRILEMKTGVRGPLIERRGNDNPAYPRSMHWGLTDEGKTALDGMLAGVEVENTGLTQLGESPSQTE